jgi:hypothetical protein
VTAPFQSNVTTAMQLTLCALTIAIFSALAILLPILVFLAIFVKFQHATVEPVVPQFPAEYVPTILIALQPVDVNPFAAMASRMASRSVTTETTWLETAATTAYKNVPPVRSQQLIVL